MGSFTSWVLYMYAARRYRGRYVFPSCFVLFLVFMPFLPRPYSTDVGVMQFIGCAFRLKNWGSCSRKQSLRFGLSGGIFTVCGGCEGLGGGLWFQFLVFMLYHFPHRTPNFGPGLTVMCRSHRNVHNNTEVPTSKIGTATHHPRFFFFPRRNILTLAETQSLFLCINSRTIRVPIGDLATALFFFLFPF